MRRVVKSVLLSVLLGLFTAGAAQLPPEIMADRYLIQAERLIAEKNHEGALEVMNKIVDLQRTHNLTVPDEFHFKYAQIAMLSGSFRAAIDSVNQYLTAAGREGQFYREALELLDEAEQNLPENVAARYLAQVERLIAKKDYRAAIEPVNKIAALLREHQLALPHKYHFMRAQVALSAGDIRAAIDSVNQYLAAAGTAGEFHREAMELLGEVEQEEEQRKQEEEQRKQEEERRKQGLPEMVEIPAGRFWMGCVSGQDCDDDEKPVHEVMIASFELSKYEVTFEEYDRFTAATGRERADDEGWGRGRRPVINVSWEDAVAYTEWLSDKTGESYRLPSEAEWEYAARSGTTTKYHFGNDESQLCRYANHADTSTNYDWRNNACSDGIGKRTAPAGNYQPNAFGLYDMHGNVKEMVQDCWKKHYRGAPTNGSALVSGNCSRRVMRGGSFYNSPRYLRAALRNWRNTRSREGDLVGFRVARSLTP